MAARRPWRLLVSPWVLREILANLDDLPPEAVRAWLTLRPLVTVEDDELTFPWPVDFGTAKDRPVLFSALAVADVLLTLDRRDFGHLLGGQIYGLWVLTPGAFLRREREAERRA